MFGLDDVLYQATVAGLGESELAFNHPEHMFHPCPDRGLSS